MSISYSSSIVVGIDVGGKNKGFHGVTLKNGQYYDRFATSDVSALASWCVGKIRASVIAVDAPCRWSISGKSRPAERDLHAKGIHCFFTPVRAVAQAHPKDNYGWMFNGEAVFRELEKTHTLCTSIPKAGQKCCFETYPHAITWYLRGGNADARQKRQQRRQLLKQNGIDTDQLTNIDWVDAALCALTAHMATSGRRMTSFGEAITGLIIVPARE
jgi:predicted nuclease with RNAse H fold